MRTLLFRGAVIGLAAVLALSGCSTGATDTVADPALLAVIDRVDVPAFQAKHPDKFVEISREAGLEGVSIANYDPTRLPPPARQDVVSWGRVGSNPATSTETVLSVAIFAHPNFYVVEFDPESKAQLFEEGTWFLSEDRDTYVRGQLELIDSLLP